QGTERVLVVHSRSQVVNHDVDVRTTFRRGRANDDLAGFGVHHHALVVVPSPCAVVVEDRDLAAGPVRGKRLGLFRGSVGTSHGTRGAAAGTARAASAGGATTTTRSTHGFTSSRVGGRGARRVGSASDCSRSRAPLPTGSRRRARRARRSARVRGAVRARARADSPSHRRCTARSGTGHAGAPTGSVRCPRIVVTAGTQQNGRQYQHRSM